MAARSGRRDAAWIALRILNDIKKQTENAGIAARAAEASANAIIRSERPWLLISGVILDSVVWEGCQGRVQGAYFVVQNYANLQLGLSIWAVLSRRLGISKPWH